VYFRSRDKDGGHIIRSDISENPMQQHANFMALSSNEPELLPIDLDLDPMTFKLR